MQLNLSGRLNTVLAKIVFLLLPTIVLCYFLIWNANQYYSILNDQSFKQTLYLGIGMIGSVVFFSFRFRFLLPTLILFFILTIIYNGIDALSFGEFDAFFKSVQFLFFAILLSAGWLIGWGFSRLRYFSIFIAALFLVSCIFILSKQNELFLLSNTEAGIRAYAFLFGPIILYSFYIIFAAILIRSHENAGVKIWWILLKRLFLFIIFAVLMLSGILLFQKNSINETIAEFGGGGKEGKNSMLKKNKDNTFDLNDYSKLSGSLGRSNELLFAAHIDHYFTNTDVPNPLYLTAFYYSKFDTLTETFERDSLLPQSDLFEPNPATISLFSTKLDSSVLKEALTDKFRSTVEIEVYKKQLSANSFVAPSTSFFIQPITVEKDFQKEFSSAYRAKSYISELNSAYFVYNASDPSIKKFQEQRFEVLRKVKDYDNINAELKTYYTFMPKGQKFDSIHILAQEITKNATLPVDKVIAVRDYFLSKDDNGKPLFSYTDNPGVPDIPSASKLHYFLFENRKGYCAYYAGATLFLLRSLGIPSRITVGFMTVDRSSQNKGWYWYYADQAHAWVQVYFPGYGWLDFDTTVGNDDARESPKPDGTPPMQPPKAFLAADGIITHVDTVNKTMSINMSRMMFHDKERFINPIQEIELDIKIASIIRDTLHLGLDQLHIGDSVTAVSYAKAFKNLLPRPNEQSIALIKRFPKPAPIDEIHLKKHIEKEQQKQQNKEQIASKTNWKGILIAFGSSVLFLVLMFLLLPKMIFTYLQLRLKMASSIEDKAYWSYTTTSFYLHQMGLSESGAVLTFAPKIDKLLDTNFEQFMKGYLKLKYAKESLSEKEQNRLTDFWSTFYKKVKNKISFKQRTSNMFKVLRAMQYF